MAKNTNKRSPKDPPPPTPSYEGLVKEMKKLQKGLAKVKKAGKDDRGDLEPFELIQLDSAIKEMGIAQTMLVCIQDHAPYGMDASKKPKKKK